MNLKQYPVFVLWIFLFLLAFFQGFVSNAQDQRCQCPPENIVINSQSRALNPREISEIQTFLRDLGLYAGEIHGRFDRRTITAVRRFQRNHGLPTSGNIDGPTWSALGDCVGGRPVSTALPSGELRLLIETNALTLTVLIDNQPFKTFPVAIGKRETPSPIGTFKVVSKGAWNGGFGTRWLGLNVPWGIYGIHGTNKPWSIGRMESHGCFRMFNRDVETLYRWIKVGTPVHVIGDPFMARRRLVRGEKGSDVLYVQRRLKQLGFYSYRPDGVYGYGTEKAVKDYQKKEKIKVTGQVGWEEYRRLRLIAQD